MPAASSSTSTSSFCSLSLSTGLMLSQNNFLELKISLPSLCFFITGFYLISHWSEVKIPIIAQLLQFVAKSITNSNSYALRLSLCQSRFQQFPQKSFRPTFPHKSKFQVRTIRNNQSEDTQWNHVLVVAKIFLIMGRLTFTFIYYDVNLLPHSPTQWSHVLVFAKIF